MALPLGELSPQVTERASLLSPQRRAFAESGVANAVSLHDPSREKAILENPQIFQNCEIKIIFPLNMARAQAEAIQNRPTPRGSAVLQTHDRPAQGSKLHRAVMCKKEDRSLLCRKHRRVARIKESI